MSARRDFVARFVRTTRYLAILLAFGLFGAGSSAPAVAQEPEPPGWDLVVFDTYPVTGDEMEFKFPFIPLSGFHTCQATVFLCVQETEGLGCVTHELTLGAQDLSLGGQVPKILMTVSLQELVLNGWLYYGYGIDAEDKCWPDYKHVASALEGSWNFNDGQPTPLVLEDLAALLGPGPDNNTHIKLLGSP